MNMIDTSKISKESLALHMEAIFKNANNENVYDSEYENSEALFIVAEKSNDTDFIEAVLKSSMKLDVCGATKLAKRLCRLQGNESNIYLEVAEKIPPSETLDRRDEEHPCYFWPTFHLRLLLTLKYDKENIDIERFIDLKYEKDEDIIKEVDNYLANQVEIDISESDERLAIIKLELERIEKERSKIDARAKALIKEQKEYKILTGREIK